MSREPSDVAMDAMMEGEAVTVANIGDKVEVSEMELFCLVQFALLGVYAQMIAAGGELADAVADQRDELLSIINESWSRDGQSGVINLMASTVAAVHSEKFKRYLPLADDEPEEGEADGSP